MYSNASVIVADTTLSTIPKGFMVAATGNVSIKMLAANGGDVTFTVTQGVIYPIRFKQLNSANTTTGSVTGLY